VTVPPPEDVALPRSSLAPILEQALAEAARKGLRSDAVTPFLLRRLRAEGGDRVVTANRALLRRNARVAARIAAAAH
jgi:pseudouridine-5'-phosphate glycosidase